jgi:hypothetical protein
MNAQTWSHHANHAIAGEEVCTKQKQNKNERHATAATATQCNGQSHVHNAAKHSHLIGET